jgi:hypothetical protein
MMDIKNKQNHRFQDNQNQNGIEKLTFRASGVCIYDMG